MTTNESIVRALGWALAHSLWQATLAALILLFVLPRMRASIQRYWISFGALAGVFVASAITFYWYYEPMAGAVLSADPLEGAGNSKEVLIWESPAIVLSHWQLFTSWLDENHALIVNFWLLGFLFFLFRLGAGIWQLHRLRTRYTNYLAPEWMEKFHALQARLGLGETIQLLESARIQTPLALGWLKPVVLLPVGLVNRLSVPEVEAVLAHELAHIARKDWVFNLMQVLVESLFYYHPAIWWISGMIRRERENCCDDAALAATGNPLAFAKALVQVQEMATPVPVVALGLTGVKRRPLLERVKRILNQPTQPHHQAMEKITATIILLALLALVGIKANSVPVFETAFSTFSNFPSHLFGADQEGELSPTDTVPKPRTIKKITQEDGEKRVEAEYRDGNLFRLNIDGKEVPKEEFEQHEEMIESIQEEVIEVPSPPTPPSGYFFAPSFPSPPNAVFNFDVFRGEMAAPALKFPDRPIRVITDKDGAGNTIIRLDNDGETTEVVVKDGEVFINGEKAEKGQAIEIEGMEFDPSGIITMPENSKIQFHSFEDGLSEKAFRMEAQEEFAAEMERYTREMNEELARTIKEQEQQLKESRRQYELEMKRSLKELERSQKEWKKQQKEWEKAQRKRGEN
jgi:beta-lactamase regulating signal transducer with metallopeptidase domain